MTKIPIKYYEIGVEVSSVVGYQSALAIINSGLGNCYFSLREYQKAIEYYEMGLRISSAIGYQSGIAASSCCLGNVYGNLGEYQRAIKYFERGLEISTTTGEHSKVANSNRNLGYIYLLLGEYKVTSTYFEKAIGLFDKIFFNFVPDRNKLFFIIKCFGAHPLLMSCLLSLERVKSALLVIDFGKAKELHFCIEKNRIVRTEI